MSVVGFDVGNDTCTVAVARQRGIDVILNDESKRETPAVVSFMEKQRYVGAASSTNPRNSVSQLKRLLGRKFADPQLQADLQTLPFKVTEGADGFPLVHVNYLGEERRFSPTQLFAMVLSNVKGLAEKNMKTAVVDCCIGIPVQCEINLFSGFMHPIMMTSCPGNQLCLCPYIINSPLCKGHFLWHLQLQLSFMCKMQLWISICWPEL